MALLHEKGIVQEAVRGNKVVFHKNDIAKIFGYGRDKTKRLLESGILPVTRLNNDYIMDADAFSKWLKQNAGKQLRF